MDQQGAPIVVNVDGVGEVEFPAGTSQQEMEVALRKLPKPNASVAQSSTPNRNDEMLNRLNTVRDIAGGIGDMNIGAAKALGRTALSTAEMFAPETVRMFTGGKTPEMLQSRNTAQDAGGLGADILTAAVPMGEVGVAAKGLRLFPRIAANAAGGAAVSRAQGHSPVAGAVGGAAGEVLGSTAGWAGRKIAEHIFDDIPAAAIALREKVLPGWFRSGEKRLGDRLGEASSGLREQLSGPLGDKPTGFIAGPAMGEVNMAAARNMSPTPAAEAAKESIDIVKKTMPRRPARELAGFAEGAQATPGSSMSAVVRRASATDARNRVASAVPEVAPTVSRLNDLSTVGDAYRGGLDEMVQSSTIPTMQGKWLVGSVNRFAGPVGQTLHDAATSMGGGTSKAVMARLASLMMGDGQNNQPATDVNILSQPARVQSPAGADRSPNQSLGGASRADLLRYADTITQALQQPNLSPEMQKYWQEQSQRVHEALQGAR